MLVLECQQDQCDKMDLIRLSSTIAETQIESPPDIYKNTPITAVASTAIWGLALEAPSYKQHENKS